MSFSFQSVYALDCQKSAAQRVNVAASRSRANFFMLDAQSTTLFRPGAPCFAPSRSRFCNELILLNRAAASEFTFFGLMPEESFPAPRPPAMFAPMPPGRRCGVHRGARETKAQGARRRRR